MEKTTLYLPTELHRALKAVAKREKRPVAELVREALGKYVSEKPRPKLRSIGAGSDPSLSGRDSEDWIKENWHKDLLPGENSE
ncbi:MAG: CopG family transcriptional regulator [Meiothermus sp.]